MPNQSLNTEIDQIFSDRPDADQTALARPERRFGWWKIVAVAVLLAALTLGLWYYLGRSARLADYLPADTEFYVALELPVQETWYRPWLFWQAAPGAGTPVARLYQKLDLLSWDKVNFSEQLLPLFRGRMELARLASGRLIFKTSLQDKAGWLKLARIDEKNYRDQVLQTLDVTPAGWWAGLTDKGNKIYWLIAGEELYLADKADLAAYFKNKPVRPLASHFGRSLIRRDLFIAYARDLSFFERLAPNYVGPIKAALAGPLIIKAQNDGQKLVWFTTGVKKTLAPAPTVGPDYDLTIFARDFSQVYAGWKNVLVSLGFKTQASLLPANIAQLEQIGKEFYQLDSESLAAKLGARDNIFYLNGVDWLFLAKGGQEPAGEDISQALKGLASSLFAITHPKAVERTLSDGSVMTELRAETDSLEWRPYAWTAGGVAYVLDYLQGQGEPRGFYTGFIPELGYVLTNQAEWLQSLPALTAVTNGANLAVTLSPGLLTNDPFILDIIKRIGVGATAASELSGYLEF